MANGPSANCHLPRAQPYHGMNVNLAWPSAVPPQGQTNHVLLCGRVRARTRTEYSPLVSSAEVAESGMHEHTKAAFSFLGVQQLFQLVGKLVDVAKMTIHRREPHVRHFIEPFQFLHYETADIGGRDLFVRPILQRRLDAVGDRFQVRHPHRPLLARFQQPRDQLLALEPLARSVLLHHHVGDLVDPLVAGEAFAALEALAAPPDHLALARFPRIDNLIAQMRAVRALHTITPCAPARPDPRSAACRRGSTLPAPRRRDRARATGRWNTRAARSPRRPPRRRARRTRASRRRGTLHEIRRSRPVSVPPRRSRAAPRARSCR